MKEYLTCAETAKLVRAALKRKFPQQKFSVRSDVYAGGASIRIHWMDGPTTKDVDAVVKCYAGGRFDGMIDMAYSVSSWLMPDGSAIVADNPGSEGSRGVDPGYSNPKPRPDAVEVRFGADYVFTERSYSVGAMRQTLEFLAKEYAMPEIAQLEIKPWGEKGEASLPQGWTMKIHERSLYEAVNRLHAEKSFQPKGEPTWHHHSLNEKRSV